ncbi:MAG: PorT family protein [Bacteroidales bacterium]|nr:PorT family protein [Bacteroidales bacterium]
MKRFIMVIALCAVTFWSSNTLMARGFGITGGASFTGLKDVSSGMTTGYHAGLTYKFKLPFGFAIQPSLMYHMKSSLVEDAYQNGSSLDLKTGYLELPVSFQWGPDLILFRPFLDVTPFVGYGLNNKLSGYSAASDKVVVEKNRWDGMNRLEYGLGLGVGIDIWKFQVIGRYNWNFGPLFDAEGDLPDADSVLESARSSILDGKNFGGLTLTVAFIF